MDPDLEEELQLAHSARRDDRPAAARSHFESAAREARARDEVQAQIAARRGLAQLCSDEGDAEAAIGHLNAAASEARRQPDRQLTAHTVRHLADVLRRSGNLADAESAYSEALSLYRADDRTPPLQLANALRGAALLKELQDASESAVELWKEARSLYERSGIDAGLKESLAAISRCSTR